MVGWVCLARGCFHHARVRVQVRVWYWQPLWGARPGLPATATSLAVVVVELLGWAWGGVVLLGVIWGIWGVGGGWGGRRWGRLPVLSVCLWWLCWRWCWRWWWCSSWCGGVGWGRPACQTFWWHARGPCPVALQPVCLGTGGAWGGGLVVVRGWCGAWLTLWLLGPRTWRTARGW